MAAAQLRALLAAAERREAEAAGPALAAQVVPLAAVKRRRVIAPTLVSPLPPQQPVVEKVEETAAEEEAEEQEEEEPFLVPVAAPLPFVESRDLAWFAVTDAQTGLLPGVDYTLVCVFSRYFFATDKDRNSFGDSIRHVSVRP